MLPPPRRSGQARPPAVEQQEEEERNANQAEEEDHDDDGAITAVSSAGAAVPTTITGSSAGRGLRPPASMTRDQLHEELALSGPNRPCARSAMKQVLVTRVTLLHSWWGAPHHAKAREANGRCVHVRAV